MPNHSPPPNRSGKSMKFIALQCAAVLVNSGAFGQE